jgi:hypothetical protein
VRRTKRFCRSPLRHERSIMRRSIFAAAFVAALVACSSTSTTGDAGGSTVNCTGSSGTGCFCAPNGGGTDIPCSPKSVTAGDGVCCASAKFPTSGLCSCVPTSHCYTQGTGTLTICKCSEIATSADGTAVPSCSNAGGLHCCMSGTPSSSTAGYCFCSSSSCLGSEHEVASCSSESTRPTCSGADVSVASCH